MFIVIAIYINIYNSVGVACLFYVYMPPRWGSDDFSGNRIAINMPPLRGLGQGEVMAGVAPDF